MAKSMVMTMTKSMVITIVKSLDNHGWKHGYIIMVSYGQKHMVMTMVKSMVNLIMVNHGQKLGQKLG